MRVDMRPKVVAKIMSKELILLFLGLFSAFAMPFYYLKVAKMRDEYAIKHEDKLLEKETL